MAAGDDNDTGGDSPAAGERGKGGGDRDRDGDRESKRSGGGGRRRDRGERSRGGQQDELAEIARRLRSLPPEALASIGLSLRTRGHQPAGPETPKMSHTLKLLAKDEAREVIDALADAAEERDEKAAREIIREADDRVADAIDANREYRKITWRQSAANARAWLVQRHGDTEADSDDDERSAAG